MPSNFKTSIHSRMLKPVALLALAVAACAGLAGCGGGGSGPGGADDVVIIPPEERPNLVLESPEVSDPAPSAGANFTLSVKVRNAGGEPSAAATARFYRSDDAAITTSDTEVGEVDVPELAVSESFEAEVSLSAPPDPGTYYYVACADAADGESGAAGNCSAPVPVAVSGPQFPASNPQVIGPGSRAPQQNLPVLDAFWVSNKSPAIGGYFTLSLKMRNTRIEISAPTRVRVYRSTDEAFTTSVTQVHVFHVWALNLYESSTAEKFVKAPSSKGDYYYRACGGAVKRESGAADNCSSAVKVDVSHNKPNLLIYKKSWTIPKGPGQLFTLQAHVRNFGGPSAATTLRFHLLPDKESPPSSDTQVAAVAVPALVTPFQRSLHVRGGFYSDINLTAPSTPGTYYYVACVDAVTDESDKTDNCRSYTIPVG